MANWDPRSTAAAAAATAGTQADVRDAGLRSYMLSVYNTMGSGVLLTGIVALLFANSGMAAQVLGTPLWWLIALAPLGFVMAMSFGQNKFSTAALQMMFWAFCTVMGLSLSTIFLRFTGASIAGTFFATAGAFAGLSLVGYTTKKNLSAMGSFMTMGLIGIIIAMVINIFLQSSGLSMAISILGVLIFAGLTAYDTQRLKNQYYEVQGSEFAGKAIVLGALTLYLDFINMFQFLLSFLGNRE